MYDPFFERIDKTNPDFLLKDLEEEVMKTKGNSSDFDFAYGLSWLLMGYAIKRDKANYEKILKEIIPPLDSVPLTQLTAITWLRSRIVFSAGMIGHEAALNSQMPILKGQLREVQVKDKLSAWAHAYAAAGHLGEKNVNLDDAIAAYKNRIESYEELKKDSKNTPEMLLQERGRIIWVQLLALQAAAELSDGSYEKVLEHIKEFSGETDIFEVISKNLLQENDDFPLWGFATIKYVAAVRKDKELFLSAHETLTTALVNAKRELQAPDHKTTFKEKADIVMGEVFSRRADVLYKKLMPQNDESTFNPS